MKRGDLLLRFMARWVASTFAIVIVAWLLQPHIGVSDFATAIWAGLALGLLNAIIRPLLILFTLPATVMTLGLFLLVINAFILTLVGHLVPGVTVDGFGWALLGAIVISLVSALINQLLSPNRPAVHIEVRR